MFRFYHVPSVLSGGTFKSTMIAYILSPRREQQYNGIMRGGKSHFWSRHSLPSRKKTDVSLISSRLSRVSQCSSRLASLVERIAFDMLASK